MARTLDSYGKNTLAPWAKVLPSNLVPWTMPEGTTLCSVWWTGKQYPH